MQEIISKKDKEERERGKTKDREMTSVVSLKFH